MTSFWFAFFLTLFAGLSTGFGSFIAFATKKENTSFLSVALGFSAGVMIYVSLTEILPHAHEQLNETFRETPAGFIAFVSFFGGVLLTALIDILIPEPQNPHEPEHAKHETIAIADCRNDSKKLMRMGVLTALALSLHNFPEGLATFISAMSSTTIAYSIAFAVALHNIPEGITVSVLIFYATGNRKKALFYSFLSGLAEPLGGVIGYFILKPFLGDTLFGIVFAVVAGIMVYISFDELLPASHEYGKHHTAIAGLFFGMAVMAGSLIFL